MNQGFSNDPINHYFDLNEPKSGIRGRPIELKIKGECVKLTY